MKKYIDLTEQQGGGSGGTTNYNTLSNQPQINGVTLTGNKTSADLGITGGVTDYTELANQPQINSVTLTGNKTSEDLGLMSNANFLPANHVITVATDGSGDFTSLVDAVNYLKGNYSNGTINIHVLSGTYAVNGIITLDESLGNISKVNIYGDGIDNTIFNFTNITNYKGAININYVNTLFTFKDLTIVNQDTAKDNRLGINVLLARAIINNCKTVNFFEGVTSARGSNVYITTKVTNNDCKSAIVAYAGGHISTGYGTQFVVTNATYGIWVDMGGTVALASVQRVFNNVTNSTNTTIGSTTANGYIGGEWHT